jgi:hypothetical protein
VTTDHEFIRDWVERRGGCPAAVKSKRRSRGRSFIQIDYPSRSPASEAILPISWDEFFDRFEQHKLAFLYSDAKVRGETSRFSKLVDRSSVLVGNEVRAPRIRR